MENVGDEISSEKRPSERILTLLTITFALAPVLGTMKVGHERVVGASAQVFLRVIYLKSFRHAASYTI
jgi:hypothetical protein